MSREHDGIVPATPLMTSAAELIGRHHPRVLAGRRHLATPCAPRPDDRRLALFPDGDRRIVLPDECYVAAAVVRTNSR